MTRVTGDNGYSLVELLVATMCVTLLSGAVFSLIVTCAIAGRRESGVLVARTAADRVVVAVAGDVSEAGRGLEWADAVQQDGILIPVISTGEFGVAKIVQALGPVVEIRAYGATSTFEVAVLGGLGIGETVAAVGLPLRPAEAPLPLGIVVAVSGGSGSFDVTVAWSATEAFLVAEWGQPRAVVAVRVREYQVDSNASGLRLRRRDNGGPWQPVVEGLESVEIDWVVDTDDDGLPDARRTTFGGESDTGLCAVAVTARAAVAAHRLAAPSSGRGDPEAAERWTNFEC